MMPPAAYKSRFLAFMWFLDRTTYSPLDDITFPQEHIFLITDAHVASFLIYKAYGMILLGRRNRLLTPPRSFFTRRQSQLL
jgi:hypothetical protein